MTAIDELREQQRRHEESRNGRSDEPPPPVDEDLGEISIVTWREFVAQEEDDPEVLVGDVDQALIPMGCDVMAYGDGGSGKTTLLLHLACCLGAGQPWLGMKVSRRFRALLIESEGPRTMYRRKLKRKVEAWHGTPFDDHVSVFACPWARFKFNSEGCRDALVEKIRALQIDVLIAGPLVELGMDEAGTLQEVRAFMRLVADVRARCGRPITVILIHHENKSGAVSGAWEGAGDVLLHTIEAGSGHTTLHIQKARWASELHRTTLKLKWTPGESFEVASAQDLLAKVLELLAGDVWLTAKEIRKAVEAGEAEVHDLLTKDHRELFVVRSGDEAKALGRSPTAILYGLAPGGSR